MKNKSEKEILKLQVKYWRKKAISRNSEINLFIENLTDIRIFLHEENYTKVEAIEFIEDYYKEILEEFYIPYDELEEE